MKKTLLIISSAVFLLSTSCEKNTEKGMEVTTHPLYYTATVLGGATVSGGTGSSVKTLTFTELDRVIVDLSTDPVITSVNVYSSDTEVGATVTISNGEGTLNASVADMGAPAAGNNNYIGFQYEFDGYKANEAAYVKTVSPWTLTLPALVENDESKNVTWKVATANATVSDVTISVKVGATGTPVNYSGQALTGTLALIGSDYTLGDKIYVKGTATAGTVTSSLEKTLTIGQWMFNTITSGVEFTTTSGTYDLDDLAFAAGGHMSLIHVAGVSLGFAGTNVEFVVSDQATMDDNNVNDIIAAFTGGAKVTSVIDIQEDEVYIFKTAADTYGMFKVISKNGNLAGDSDDDSFIIDILTL